MAGLFDEQAGAYASSRPIYPAELYEFIVSLAPRHSLAWDVGTGNGQAALALAEHFDKVIATDVSEEQLKRAPQRPNISYASTASNVTTEDARRVVGEESTVDLITVAQALHWFDLDSFHGLVARMLVKPGGIVAAWTYDLLRVDGGEVDKVIAKLYEATQPYWAPERAYVDQQYRTIAFPYVPAAGQTYTGPFEFQAQKETDLEGLLCYFSSWSAIQTALNKGVDFVSDFKDAFQQAWGDPHTLKTITWPIYLRAGTVA